MSLSCAPGRDETKHLCLTAQHELCFCFRMHTKCNFSTSPLYGDPMKPSQIQWFQWVRPPPQQTSFVGHFSPDIGALMLPSSNSSCVCCRSMDKCIQWKEIIQKRLLKCSFLDNYLVTLRKISLCPYVLTLTICKLYFPWMC